MIDGLVKAGEVFDAARAAHPLDAHDTRDVLHRMFDLLSAAHQQHLLASLVKNPDAAQPPSPEAGTAAP